MYCKECGKEISDNAKFCEHCGKELEATETEENTGGGGCLGAMIMIALMLFFLGSTLQTCGMLI